MVLGFVDKKHMVDTVFFVVGVGQNLLRDAELHAVAVVTRRLALITWDSVWLNLYDNAVLPLFTNKHFCQGVISFKRFVASESVHIENLKG